MITNVPPLQIVPVSGRVSLKNVADFLGGSLPGVENFANGGNLNAFVAACEQVLRSADEQQVALSLGGANVVAWYRDRDRDKNPVEPGAVGAPLGDRIYCETDLGWLWAGWSGIWYVISDNETPDQKPCDQPGYLGCLPAKKVLGLVPGTVPGEMAWRPAENPDMQPEGELFVTADEYLDPSQTIPTIETADPLTVPIIAAVVAAAAFFFFD